jgi:uncharacterized membrane protein
MGMSAEWLLLQIISAALVVLTVGMVGRSYSSLPARIPIHFGLFGQPDQYGSRPMIWLLPAVQAVLVVAAGLVIFAAGAPAHGAAVIIELEISALFTLITRGQIRVALGQAQKLGGAVFFGIAIVLITGIALGRLAHGHP